ncbi:Early nodulin-like protein 2 [Nymphaea thermarum]|nr:Early nodulin-like protein 2 [Nymphaea thermarum]
MASFSPAVAGLLLRSIVIVMVGVLTLSANGLEFRVGGPRGWVEPTGNDTDKYNEWASENRFHIGDSLYFKYENDSVLVVNGQEYSRCNNSFPIHKFKDGNTSFMLDRFGYFYFISGTYSHCRNGQRLIIRVMAQPAAPAPEPTGPGGDDDEPATHNPPPEDKPNSTATVTASGLLLVVALAFMFLVPGPVLP